MAVDDPGAPLRQNERRKLSALAVALGLATIGILSALVTIFATWAIVVDDPLGGEPSAVASINPAIPVNSVKNGLANPIRSDQKLAAAGKLDASTSKNQTFAVQTVTIIDGSTGKRQDVTVSGSPERKAVLGDARIVEASPHGLIPKIAVDGARAIDVYAQPPNAAARQQNLPWIAIVIVGLGGEPKATDDTIVKLPGAVTLGFAPYGGELEHTIALARNNGHEILLRVPMEPFGYPKYDPGPQTLLSSLASEQNIDRLHWLMSRFQGYVGIVNHMGSRFTASEAAVTPVLKEIAKRGLLYVDDGSSPRSLASKIAEANDMPFAKSDLDLDAIPTANELHRSLAKLESMARARGVAIAMARPLSVSIDGIAQWAKTAESRGLLLVSITAAAAKIKSMASRHETEHAPI